MLFSTSVFASAENTTNLQSIKWLDYSNSVFEQSKSDKHYILLYGKSKTCHWCQEMDKTTWHTLAVIQMVKANFVPVLVDLNAELNIAMQYHISAQPTMIILDSTNRVIKIFVGYFDPDAMAKNLKIVAESYNTPLTPNYQPIVIKEEEPTTVITLLPDTLREQLEKKQFSMFENINDTNQAVDLSTIEYALTLSLPEEKLAQAWINTGLKTKLTLLDPVWGGVYLGTKNGMMHYEKATIGQGDLLMILSLAYSYWHDPSYLDAAKHLVNYANNFLLSPEGAYYAGQSAYTSLTEQTAAYYQSDNQQRRKMGVPLVDKHIFPYANGVLINGLLYYYMVSMDHTALQNAQKATQSIIDHLSIPGGGFRHEKIDNSAIYLNDTLTMGNAFLTLYKVTAENGYLNRAVDAARFIDKYFPNSEGKPGYLTSLSLSGNSSGPSQLDANENANIVRFTTLLFHYTGEGFLQKMQMNALKYLMVPDVVTNNSPTLALMAEYRIAKNPIHVAIVGAKGDPQAKMLFETALANSILYTRLDWWDKKEGPLMNSTVTYPVTNQAAAFVCHGFQCSFPLYHSQDLLAILQKINEPRESMPTHAIVESKGTMIQSNVATDDSSSAEKLLCKQNWIFIIIGFLGFGLLLSFTPCILPLVPIMASIIVGQTIGVKKEKTFLLCLSYVLSMSLTYCVLGLIAGAFGVYLQVYMQSRSIIIFFSLLFLLLALSMLDAFELKLPNCVLQKVNKWSNLQKGGSYYGVMIMGCLSTLIISPCVSAPLAGVLSYITKTGDYVLGAVGLFFMSFGMGIPLLIISVCSKNILQKASEWNNQIKAFFGLILLGVSIWIASRVFSTTVSMMLWSALIIFSAIYVGIYNTNVQSLIEKFWKTLTIMAFVYGIALFLNALLINSDLYRLVESTQRSISDVPSLLSTPHSKDIKNMTELDQALNEAKISHRPVLLDFSAAWCTACVAMDKNVLHNQLIIPLLKKFLYLHVDLTNVDKDSMSLAHHFNVIAPPMVLFFDSTGQLLNLRVTGEIDVDRFQAVLQQVLSDTHQLEH